jgi:hypothetical protein
MAYSRGTSSNIIVGAAALFAFEGGQLSDADLPAPTNNQSYKENLDSDSNFRNVGYTSNGLELTFQPDFGEVKVDQVLDVAKMYKQGMQVNMKTSFAEATLKNLLLALARPEGDVTEPNSGLWNGETVLNLSAGNLGECPVERGLVAVGPGSGDCAPGSEAERIYVAYRALSIDSVTISAKREEATMFDVSFRLLPNDNASYGKVVDRTIGTPITGAVTVPSVTAGTTTVAQAKSALLSAGLTVGSQFTVANTEYSGGAGKVASLSPISGTEVPAGSEIDVNVLGTYTAP